MIASMTKHFILAGFLALCMLTVRVASQDDHDLVCPHDYSVLPLGDAGEIDTISHRKKRRFLVEDGVVPPIEVIEQGGDYVDFVVHNTTAFTIVPDHLFVQHAQGTFFAEKCNLYEGLGAGEASEVKRARCIAGKYAVVWVYARSVAPGEHSATIPKCCHDAHAADVPVDANTLKFAYELQCVPSCDDPVNKSTDAPTDSPTIKSTDAPTDSPTIKSTDAPTDSPTIKSTDAPTDSPTIKSTDAPSDSPTIKSTDAPTDSPTIKSTDAPTDSPTQRAPRRSLQEDIIKDMMPPASGKCSGNAANSTYEFQSSQAESQWNAAFAPFEEELFLAKMQHIDSNAKRSWTIRFGQAGNIYSMVGPMGETVPPQDHTNAPWVDEVWQAVQPLGPGGDNDGNPNTDKYFIHEAGIYTKDGDNTAKPFYSPTLGSYCNDADGECAFASWGQHAHVPTPWKSPMLYLNRYVNCGNGVFEYTTLRHNIAGSDETFGYLNVPWGGTRRSVLGDVVLTKKSTQELVPVYPLMGWGEGANKPLKDTMGFTIFAEDLPKNSNPLHDQPYTDLPNGLNLKRAGNDCFCENNCRKPTNRYVCELVAQTANIGWAPNRGSPGLILRLEGESSQESVVAGVRHWAGNNKLYFYQSNDLTLAKVRAALPRNDRINVYHYYPSEEGKPEEDNLALAHVHGGQNGSGSYPRVRYGMAGRDYNVYTINDTPSIGPGASYYYRQYFMMDAYTEMKSKGQYWAPEVTKATKGQGSIAGRTVTLYTSSTNTFGHVVATAPTTATAGDDNVCRRADAVSVCEGFTTPKSNWKPLFAIYCGDSHVATDNLYHFSPAGPPYRSYVCDGMPGTRPVWTLLGYFPANACSAVASGYEYDADYC